MENLFNENIVFIFFFAMLAIYNYSDLKEYQRMSIIYISVYALAFLNIIGVKLALLLLVVSLFCFFEIFTSDEMKFRILLNPVCKIVDFLYLSFAQYAFGGMCFSLFLLRVKFHCSMMGQDIIFKLISLFILTWTLTAMLQQKFVVRTFTEMYKPFSRFPINKVEFNERLMVANKILISVEDRLYYDRDAYTFLSPSHILGVLRNKLQVHRGRNKLQCFFSTGNRFIKNIFNESRGYSTIPMQLVRSLGIKRGYNCKYRRKIFEIIYSRMFFEGIKRMFNEDQVAKRKHFKKYLLYIYFHQVNTFLGDATFSRFLNAFNMVNKENSPKDIQDCSKEGIFIACMGLSKRATGITRSNIDYYLQDLGDVELDSEVICHMVDIMMDKPFNGNYLR